MVGLSTQLIHADDSLSRVPDIVAPINTSTTFRYDNDPTTLRPYAEKTAEELNEELIYSRLSHPNAAKVEAILSKILGGHAVAYSSGLAAFYGLFTLVHPKQVAIGPCYHGVHGIVALHKRKFGLKELSYSEEDLEKLQPGDLVHIETPVNPLGESKSIQWFADRAHAKGALLSVDATFAPPPLQDPFKFGADIVLHSATKYFGGHSDLLAGVVVVKDEKQKLELLEDRVYLGGIINGFDSYLLLRSLRTYELRIKKQSENVLKIVTYLNEHKHKFAVLKAIAHSSLQTEPFVKEQLEGGYNPVFSIFLDTVEHAKHLPSRLQWFHHATSLGGVESLIEWRAMTDTAAPPTLLRVSIGAEDPEDLIADLEQGLKALESS